MSVDEPGDHDVWLPLLALASAPTWETAACVLEEHPALLRTEVEELLVTVGARAMQGGDRDLADTLLEAALLVRLARESGPALAVREVTERALPRHVAGPEALGRMRVEGFRSLRDEAVALTGPALTATGSDVAPAVEAAARAWTRILGHPEFPRLPPGLVAMTVGEASPLLWLAHTAKGDPALLDVLADGERRAAGCVPEGSPEQGDHLTGLGRALHRRFALTGDTTALDQAIAAYEQALPAVPTVGVREDVFTTWDHQDVAQEAGNAHRDRYEVNGDLQDLDRATALHRAAVDATPAEAPALARRLGELGNDLRLRYERTSSAEVLAEAIRTLEQALAGAAPDDRFLPTFQANLGNTLRDRSTRTGNADDLERAMALHREAVARASPRAPWHHVHDLGLDLRVRYRRSGDPRDSEEALASFDAALDRMGTTDPDRPMVIMDRATAIMDRFERTGSTDDIDEAVALYRRSVELTPQGSARLPLRLFNLANVLYTRYGSTGDLTDLDEALRVLADATGRNPAPNDRAMIDTARGLILNARYDAQGEPTDLGAAMAAFEDALELGPSPSDRAWVLSTFGLTLQKRYTRTTRIDDLDRACALLRDAVEATGQGSPDWAIRANNLAVALEQRYHLFRRQQDLDEAIARVETAKERLGRSAPDLPAVLTTLGALLAERHNSQAARPDDAVRAQAALRRAVDLTPRGSTHRSRRLSTLGAILITWYQSTGEPRFLDSATRTFREAVDEAPEDAPERAVYLRNLAESYRMTYERTRDPADLDTTLAALRRCCAVALDVDVESAFSTGRTWGDWAAGRGAWPEALEAFGIAVDAAERAFRAQLLRREKETWLRQGGNLGGRAAQAAARTGDAVAAVVYLERGRALLLSEVLELARAEVGVLSSGSDAALARAFERAAQRWLELSRGADRGAPSLPVIGA